ncbi:hypothetical protein ACLOJK_005524 [Asimina triloba]
MAKSYFKQEHDLEKRRAEAARIREKYPDRIPGLDGIPSVESRKGDKGEVKRLDGIPSVESSKGDKGEVKRLDGIPSVESRKGDEGEVKRLDGIPSGGGGEEVFIIVSFLNNDLLSNLAAVMEMMLMSHGIQGDEILNSTVPEQLEARPSFHTDPI